MSLKRSTNERVLARHHLKRLPQAKPAVSTAAGALPAVSTVTVTRANTVSNVVSVLPGIGTNAVPPSATTPLTSSELNSPTATVTTPVASTQSPPPSVSSTPSVAPSATSSATPSVTYQSASPSRSPSAPAQVTSSSSPSPTATADQSATSSAKPAPGNLSASSKSSLSPGAAGGIAVVAVLLAALAAGFFLRRRSRHRRNMRRNTWGAGLVPTLESKRDSAYATEPFTGQSIPPSGIPESERLANVPRTTHMSNVPRTTHMSQTHSLQGMPALPAPVSSYNSGTPISPFMAAPVRAPSLRSSTISSAAPSSELATVARTFIPSLPDELQIANGEQITILSAYDDGWALCANFRGDQGVVPLECLDRSTSVPAEMQLQPQSEFSSDSNKTLRRMSSLAPNTAGTY